MLRCRKLNTGDSKINRKLNNCAFFKIEIIIPKKTTKPPIKTIDLIADRMLFDITSPN